MLHKLRRRLHKFFLGHWPDYYVWQGVSGRIYFECKTCEEEFRQDKERRLKKAREKIQ